MAHWDNLSQSISISSLHQLAGRRSQRLTFRTTKGDLQLASLHSNLSRKELKSRGDEGTNGNEDKVDNRIIINQANLYRVKRAIR